MIRHIVFFKFDPNKPEAAQTSAKLLRELPKKIDVIRYLQVGFDVTHSSRSYDMALICDFDHLADLAAYDVHPEHQKVREYIHSVRIGTAACDFEYDA
ncbi:MAG: Dabb family protein [Christensenellales bacterium]|jgi:hypothetical protein